MGLTRVKRTVPRYKDYDQGRRHIYERPYLCIIVITQGSFRIIL
jgi:hypothetical protein